MEIKLFGKSLFKATKNELYWGQASDSAKKTKYLPDFFSLGNSGNSSWESSGLLQVVDLNTPVKSESSGSKKEDKKDPRPAVEKAKLTPKNVYDLKMLNDKSFQLNTDPVYVDKQVADFKDKLSLLSAEEYDMRRGVDEVSSVLLRMENRKKYKEAKDFFDEFPYTTTSKINELLKGHDYLKLGQVAQFVADMPKEAIKIMKDYNTNTNKICQKQAVFYIVADKKDFQKTNTRRDPILLAQSPFGHFWQILGAWDKEMLFLEEL